MAGRYSNRTPHLAFQVSAKCEVYSFREQDSYCEIVDLHTAKSNNVGILEV